MTALLLLLATAQDDKAAEEAIDAFKSAIRGSSEAERVAAVAELAKVRHPKVLARLAPLLSSDGSTVRMAAAKGLAEFADLRKHASGVLLGALPANAKQPGVQAAILEAVGALREPAALPALHKAFDEKETAVAKAAVAASGGFKSAASVEPLIEILKKVEKILKSDPAANVTAGTVNGYEVTARDEAERKRAQELRPAVLKALQEITGENLATGAEWQAWWAKNKAGFRK